MPPVTIVLYSHAPINSDESEEIDRLLGELHLEIGERVVGKGSLGWNLLIHRAQTNGCPLVIAPSILHLGLRSAKELADRLEEAYQAGLQLKILGSVFETKEEWIRAARDVAMIQAEKARVAALGFKERMQDSPEYRTGRLPDCQGCFHEARKGTAVGHSYLGAGRIGSCRHPGCPCKTYVPREGSREADRRSRLIEAGVPPQLG